MLEHKAYLLAFVVFEKKKPQTHSDSRMFLAVFWCCDNGVISQSEAMEYYLIILLQCFVIIWHFVLCLHVLFSVICFNDDV